MMEMRVDKPGVLSLVQDLGRYGYQRYGVPVNGAMDEWAHRLANALVGNDDAAATLECTLIGPTLRFTHNTLIAITGADLQASIDGQRLPLNQALMVRRDVPIQFNRAHRGARAYVSVRGGLDVPPVLGSRSTFVRAGYGGHEGRALIRGDRIPIARRDTDMLSLERLLVQCGTPFVTAGEPWREPASASQAIRFIRGPQWRRFTAGARRAFLSNAYTVTQQSDRMGYRMQGEALSLTAPLEMISEAVNAGTVQVPPNGQPIILMADRQTAGGYPKLAYVATVDLSKVAQSLPGDALRFEAISTRQAERLLWMQRQHLIQLASAAKHALR